MENKQEQTVILYHKDKGLIGTYKLSEANVIMKEIGGMFSFNKPFSL